MRLHAQSRLDWRNEAATLHALSLTGKLQVSKIFKGPDPALELATHSTKIHKEIVGLLMQSHIPMIIANTGIDPEVPGRLHSRHSHHIDTSWVVNKAETPTDAALEMDIDAVLHIRTDRPVHPVQALAATRAALAELLATQVMGALKKKYLGMDEVAFDSSYRTQGDVIVEHDVREAGSAPDSRSASRLRKCRRCASPTGARTGGSGIPEERRPSCRPRTGTSSRRT